jgi:proteasome accessory factor C
MSPSVPAPDAGARLRRLLVLLAYLARVGEAPLSDLEARFDLDRETLVADLELAACCGLPPYTPDQLLELVVEDDRVLAYGLEALRQPVRLTPDEGFALAAATRGLLAVPGVDAAPLRGALAKLESALGEDRLVVELEMPSYTVALQRLAAWGEQVAITYLSARSPEPERREVEPFAVVAREGHYYLDAFCHLADDWRRFRIDRISAIEPLGVAVEPRTLPAAFAGARAFAGGGSSRPVRLAVDASAAPGLERVAASAPTPMSDGRVEVTIEVADAGFLGRLLLSLGSDAEVLEPASLRNAAATTARRALARYEETTSRR